MSKKNWTIKDNIDSASLSQYRNWIRSLLAKGVIRVTPGYALLKINLGGNLFNVSEVFFKANIIHDGKRI